jgi:iron-sulfur cluster repair protein YtfE (RIC family)
MADQDEGRAAGDQGPIDALELLRNDHRLVDRMFEGYSRANVAQKDTVFEQIKHELDSHATVEEELFYPALRASGGRAAEMVEKAELEHFGVKTLLGAIAYMQPSDAAYDARVQELRDDVREHVAEEEAELFEAARRQLGAARLLELGAQMATRKAALRVEMADAEQ